MQSQRQQTPHVVVVGAGVIGTSIAYHLAQLNHPSTIIEQHEIACAASGKAGGFLAKDWCDSTPVRHLARPSFDMHREFSTSLGTDIGYRTMQAYSVSLVSPSSSTARLQTRAKKLPQDINWLNGSAQVVGAGRRIGTTDTNAQVHPCLLSHAFFKKANSLAGSKVLYGKVEDVRKGDDAPWHISVKSRQGDNFVVRADIVVLAMGPWSIQARSWFPQLPPIMAHKAASLVIKASVPPVALFTEYVNARGRVREPEAYPRHDEVYVCQSAVPEDLPDDPAMISIDRSDAADLKDFASAISSDLEQALYSDDNFVAQACNLPTSPDGIPVIGQVPGCEGAYIATGHSCWGILNSPATGKGLAELIVNGCSSSINLTAFSPARFQ